MGKKLEAGQVLLSGMPTWTSPLKDRGRVRMRCLQIGTFRGRIP